MSDLETQLRALAKNGELTYLSVTPVAGKGEHGVTFVARVSPATRWGHSDGRDDDPVNAILKAIDGIPKSFKTEKRAQPRVARTVEEVVAVQNGDPLPPEREPWDIV